MTFRPGGRNSKDRDRAHTLGLRERRVFGGAGLLRPSSGVVPGRDWLRSMLQGARTATCEWIDV